MESDREWLTRWFQPRHLWPHNVAGARRAFAAHSARVVVLDDVLKADVAAGLSRFLEHEAPLKLHHGLFSRGRVDRASWEAASEEDRFFRYEALGEGPPRKAPTADLFVFLSFRQMLGDSRLGALFAELTGLELGPLASQDVHAMRRGHVLKPHSDRDDDRRLAFVFYLSSDWDETCGGALAIRDRSGGVSRIAARCNRLALFDLLAHDSHWVTPVTSRAAGRPRLSIGGWFSRKDGAGSS